MWDTNTRQLYLDAVSDRCLHPFQLEPNRVWVYFMKTIAPSRVLIRLDIDLREYTDAQLVSWRNEFQADRAEGSKPLPNSTSN
jgi:hypothetical protein